ncbi:glycogen/starch/alpha-glucan phosphorylase [Ligilactobacillus sp. WILCCON 0076]|uniref:Alpha-1,4 glucan phosphorylase n=1 Tax=Ligilactobacillus ubinensis TaxID=2876789 RepID=A0A9X2FJ40_9LACO|nr:glycogen/starch/alpha-glucan phosphorylase [Ligilactobacillus ubinensis]MCP0886314.1 glycogen/starch/alpha-glucan phosphorylase [Ligilactobacillus ubinensis]
MEITKKNFVEAFQKRLEQKYALDVNDATNNELYDALSSVIKSAYTSMWRKTWKDYLQTDQKQVYYFSIEFLPGRLLKSNLLNMGWLDIVNDGLNELGLNLDDIVQAESDMALGNGGLGRLASCFMDSLASEGFPGNGNGIRYKYGLFKQCFVNGYQVELPNEWLKTGVGNTWEIRRDSKAVMVKMGGHVHLEQKGDYLEPVYDDATIIRAVPYDVGMVGYENQHVNTLRLWDAEIPENEEIKYPTIEARRNIEDLTSVLYPDDSNEDGKRLRLQQEYFFVSAGVQSIMRHYLKYKKSLNVISDYIAIHINDTHPAMCIAEFMRILLDECHLSWEDAWRQTVKVMSYTNHTILSEALEKWDVQMLNSVQPRILQIIAEIDNRYVASLAGKADGDFIERTRIIAGHQVHMAHLAIIGSHSTNGVAKLHTELLKTDVLKDFYTLYPERFNNKTNGIAERRWLQLANPALTKVIDETIGTKWHTDVKLLHELMEYTNDKSVIQKIGAAKHENKKILADLIKVKTGIEVSPEAIFDVQIKRLHAYKRQLLNLLRIVKIYLDLKENPDLSIVPRVFIFGAKAAPSYHYAKSIIKCINEVANLINNDVDIQNKLKVVFLENYGVTLAEKIIPAADVSEQISTASKEASGTSNMKLMLDGAITVATLDGANIEIKDRVGNENIFIFGLTKDEVYKYYENHSYHSSDYYNNNPVIHRVLDAFVDGTIPNIQAEGHEIFDSLTYLNDDYFVLCDFEDYLRAQSEIDEIYRDQSRWNKMSLINTANGGFFSSDDTIRSYASDIWQIKSITKAKRVDNNGKYPL